MEYVLSQKQNHFCLDSLWTQKQKKHDSYFHFKVGFSYLGQVSFLKKEDLERNLKSLRVTKNPQKSQKFRAKLFIGKRLNQRFPRGKKFLSDVKKNTQFKSYSMWPLKIHPTIGHKEDKLLRLQEKSFENDSIIQGLFSLGSASVFNKLQFCH